MAYISKIRVPGNPDAYLIKDSEGRLMIAPEYSSSTSYSVGDYYMKDGLLWKVATGGTGAAVIGATTSVANELQSIKQSIARPMNYIGVTKTELTDDSKITTLEPATQDSLTKETGFVAGDVVLAPAPADAAEKFYEYVWNGSQWSEFGSTKALGKMAYANTATGSTTITYKDTTYTGTVDVNEYSGDDESAVKIKTTSVVGSVEAGTTSASSVTKKNKYLGTTNIWTGDSASAVTGIMSTTKRLNTTTAWYPGDTLASAVTEVTTTQKGLVTTEIYGVERDGVNVVSNVNIGSTSINVGATAKTSVVTGLTGGTTAASGSNPFVSATVENECLSWIEKPLGTTEIREASTMGIPVPEITVNYVTGIAKVASSNSVTVATGELDDRKTGIITNVKSTSVRGFGTDFSSFTVATGGISDDGSGGTIVTGIDYHSKDFVHVLGGIDVATGQLSDTEAGANIADAIEVTPVDGLVTGLSVTKNDKVLEKCDPGETGIKVLTNIVSSKKNIPVNLTENVKNETVKVEITVHPDAAPGPEPKYLTMTIPTDSQGTKISIKKQGTPVGTNIQYRVNSGEWTNWDFTNPQAEISANANDVIQWKGVNTNGLSNSSTNYISFDIPNEVDLSGNVMSLIDGVGDTEVIPCSYCFHSLFKGTKIKTVTKDFLPATKLASDCYYNMFSGCTSLVSAPALPATTIAGWCYWNMFIGCTSLVDAPELPATTLTPYCYSSMFNGCTSLATAPALPATTLAERCYSSMFQGCTSLVDAPELPATTLTPYCYSSMFNGCTSLVNAPALPATTLAEWCYNVMFKGCTSLVTAPDLSATTLADKCCYNMFCGCTSLVDAPALPARILADSCYAYMFEGCSSLVDAPALPATMLAASCYSAMFYKCTSLKNAPALPATSLAESCYNGMFSGCSSIVKAPELHATTLADYCYAAMFNGCTSLATAPVLSATTLKESCYSSMFEKCKSLVDAPALKATTLASSCYRWMFRWCSKLQNVTCLATDISAQKCTTGWLDGVASTGTFNKAADVTWSRDVNGIPEGWTVNESEQPTGPTGETTVQQPTGETTVQQPTGETTVQQPTGETTVQQ